MPELVTIPISFFEVTFEYDRPNLALWSDRGPIVQAIFDGLQAWNPKVDDIEPIITGKLSEQGFIIKLPLMRASFFFGPAWCRFSRDAVDWNLAAETVAMLDAATTAFVRLTGMVIKIKKTAIGVHLQPRTKPFIEILGPFMALKRGALEDTPLRTMAIVAKWDKRKVTIDGSGALANGIFLKIERDFESAATSVAMAEQLRSDEEELFAILGVKEDL
jgi:hypothetical protein